MNGSVSYDDLQGNHVEEMLTTYSEEERQENQINKENAELIWKQKHYTVIFEFFRIEGLQPLDACILSFICQFFGGSGGRFYFSNERLAKVFGVHPDTIGASIKRLKDKELIDTSKKVKAGGGLIRFINLPVESANHRFANLRITDLQKGKRPMDLIEDNLVEDNKEKIYKKEKFEIPSIEDIKAYCKERANGINPEHFLDYYQSNGWKVGRNPMKDWQAAIRTWEKNHATSPPPKKLHLLGENPDLPKNYNYPSRPCTTK